MYNIRGVQYPKVAFSGASAVADQRLTVDATVGGVQFSAFNAVTTLVTFDVQDADVMCTLDGSAPTTTNGHRLYQGTNYTWDADMAKNAKFIRQAGVSAALHLTELQA